MKTDPRIIEVVNGVAHKHGQFVSKTVEGIIRDAYTCGFQDATEDGTPTAPAEPEPAIPNGPEAFDEAMVGVLGGAW